MLLYDQGDGRRRWRGLDLGYTRFWLEAAAPRVCCSVHGVVVAQVPWARHGSGFIRAVEDQVAWLATQCSQSACSQLMRVDGRRWAGSSAGWWRRSRAAATAWTD